MFRNMNPGAIGIKGSMAEVLPLARDAGFEGIDLNVRQAGSIAKEKSIDEVQRMFADAGMRMGGWGLPVDFRKDEETHQQGLQQLPELAKIGRALECTRVPTWVRPVSDELAFKENFELHARRLRGCAEILRDHGCWLGLEFVAPKTSRIGHKYEFIHDLPGMLELCDEIGTGNVGLLLDCWHWYTAHGTIEQIRSLRPEQVVYVHVNDAPAGVAVDEQIDSVRCLPGATGVIDIAGFLKALAEIGCTAPVTPEPFVKELREMPAAEAAKTVGETMDKIWQAGGLA